MKMFSNIQTEGMTEAVDRVGGFTVFDSGVYDATVTLAYVQKARNSDAQSIVVHYDIGGQELRETYWFMSKEGNVFSIDKKDKNKKNPLPGFTSVNDLCLLTTGFPLEEQSVEEKVVKLYNFEERKELPQTVPVLVDVIGKAVTLGVIQQTVDKQVKNADGNYVNTGETRDENIVDKIFHAEMRKTVVEIKTGQEEAAFIGIWETKNKGKTRNRAKGAEGKSGAPGAAGRPAPGGAPGTAPKASKSLFGG